MTKKKRLDGKDFENEFSKFVRGNWRPDWCIHPQVKRYYDMTSAAGSYIPAGHADFQVFALPRMCLAVECKSTNEHETLPSGWSSLVKKDQTKNLRIHCLSGSSAVYLFKNETTKTYEAWKGFELADFYVKRKPRSRVQPPKELRLYRGKILSDAWDACVGYALMVNRTEKYGLGMVTD